MTSPRSLAIDASVERRPGGVTGGEKDVNQLQDRENQPRNGYHAPRVAGGAMRPSIVFGGVLCVTVCSYAVLAQNARQIPRPAPPAEGPPRAEDGSAAPDGYQPLPQWLGQTRA